MDKIVRPAYKSVMQELEYVPLDQKIKIKGRIFAPDPLMISIIMIRNRSDDNGYDLFNGFHRDFPCQVT